MFDLSDPHSWTYFTNWVLVAVAFVAAAIIGYGVLRQKRARVTGMHPAADSHTFVLPDLGVTMADGGEKINDKKKPQKPA